jgi:hypothetical protein
MRRSLLRVTTAAAAMAVGIIVPTTAQPAQADVGTVIAVIKQVYSVYQQFASGGGLTLAQAVQQINAQIHSAQQAITDQIDLVATASVQACATSAVINFADIDLLSPDNLQAFALDATSCVTQAQSLLSVVTDKTAVDRLGFAMNTVGPLALMARTKAGLTTPALKAVLVAGENTLITALLPTCRLEDQSGGEPGVPHFYLWDCFAYNGTGGLGARADRAGAENRATSDTSRAIAQAALPQLG